MALYGILEKVVILEIMCISRNLLHIKILVKISMHVFLNSVNRRMINILITFL